MRFVVLKVMIHISHQIGMNSVLQPYQILLQQSNHSGLEGQGIRHT